MLTMPERPMLILLGQMGVRSRRQESSGGERPVGWGDGVDMGKVNGARLNAE